MVNPSLDRACVCGASRAGCAVFYPLPTKEGKSPRSLNVDIDNHTVTTHVGTYSTRPCDTFAKRRHDMLLEVVVEGPTYGL